MDLLNVLIVDDQPSTCKEVATFLKGKYNVHAFKSGKEALEFLERNSVDLILLDYYMPEMTGFEVLLQIRQNQALADTPAIFLTSEINERMEREMRQRGASDYLTKPIDSAKLFACIKKHLG
ncbi:MAG: response regulator [Defluviitaleaceae bacterium]|nr:response regulator [Defluviitaleaceae bacterium]